MSRPEVVVWCAVSTASCTVGKKNDFGMMSCDRARVRTSRNEPDLGDSYTVITDHSHKLTVGCGKEQSHVAIVHLLENLQ